MRKQILITVINKILKYYKKNFNEEIIQNMKIILFRYYEIYKRARLQSKNSIQTYPINICLV